MKLPLEKKENNNNPQSYAARPHVLIVDDDERIRSLLRRYLAEHDFVTVQAAGAAEAKKLLCLLDIDVAIVDVMMPGQSGTEFVEKLRSADASYASLPVLLLTALGETQDRIDGLESGADDYLVKPFEPRELLLRLHAILKRSESYRRQRSDLKSYRIGDWVFDPRYDELSGKAQTLSLTQSEAGLLRALTERCGEVVSRESLVALGGDEAGERAVDVQVNRLRKKIEEDSKNPRLLQTVRGRGYILRAEIII